MKKQQISYLKELTAPLTEFLKNEFDPYCSIIINKDKVKLVRDEIGIPIKNEEPADL